MKTACNFHWCCLPGVIPNCLLSSLLTRDLVGVGPHFWKHDFIKFYYYEWSDRIFRCSRTICIFFVVNCLSSSLPFFYSIRLLVCFIMHLQTLYKQGINYSHQTSLPLPIWQVGVLLWRCLSLDEDSTLCLKPMCIFCVNSAHAPSSRGSYLSCVKVTWDVFEVRECSPHSACLLVQGIRALRRRFGWCWCAPAIVSQGPFCRGGCGVAKQQRQGGLEGNRYPPPVGPRGLQAQQLSLTGLNSCCHGIRSIHMHWVWESIPLCPYSGVHGFTGQGGGRHWVFREAPRSS